MSVQVIGHKFRFLSAEQYWVQQLSPFEAGLFRILCLA